MAWKIEPTHSSIEFSVKHMMISTVRGRFTEFDGVLEINPNDLLTSKVTGYVNAASVDTHESNRDGHLRSGDFFDVENHPRLTFASKRIEPTGGDRYRVTGDLTIRNVTREVTFEVTDEGRNKDPWGGLRWGLTGSTTINRKDFGLTWNVALETGGWLVADQIKMHAELQLIQVPDEVKEGAAAELVAA